VTQVPEPDTTFVLPPPRPREAVVPERQITVPEARQPTETISRVQRPTREVLEVERATPQVTRIAPTLRAEEQARLTATPALQPSIAPTREISVPAVRAQIRDIPMPSRGTTPGAQPGTSTSNAPAPSGTSSTAGTTAPGGQQPAPGSGTNPAAQPGAGTTPNAPPGAWPSSESAATIGAWARAIARVARRVRAARSRACSSPTARRISCPKRHRPGRTHRARSKAHIADLDRAGQWLKRPPYDYTPTTFDKYWRPRESLLQEWVRRGIKTITIPIPGTGKRLQCAVSLLALGGACGLTDPNVNEQPASARTAAGHSVQAVAAGRQRQHPHAAAGRAHDSAGERRERGASAGKLTP
jgi:hypothetical protein